MVREVERRKYLESFKKVYAGLNAEQKKAVETIEGPVLVVAGPGTGKTQVLAVRIANILLKTDTPARAILALTFTDSGVKAMKERLISLIGPEAYQVNIYTFHSFCSDVIKDNPDKFVITEELEPLSQLERVQIFREILDEGSWEVLRPFGSRYYYVRSLIKSIQDLKREGIGPEDLEKVLKNHLLPSLPVRQAGARGGLREAFGEKDVAKNLELIEVYKRYQEKLKEKSRYDFEDMISLVVESFEKDPEFLRKYQERFQYLLLDEFQDTNSSQNQVVRQLADYWGNAANVFAVGDDEQSIYRFQGASLENILYFNHLYPKALVIALKENYRSPQSLLEAAFSLIQHNRVRLADYIKGIQRHPVSVRKRRGGGAAGLKTGHFASGITESFFVAQKIKELTAAGTEPQNIAIVYRHNNDAADFADTLSRLSVPYRRQAGEDVLKDHDLEKLLRLLGVILKVRSKDEDLDLFTLFNYEFLRRRFGFDYLDTLKLSRFASDLKVNFFEAIRHADFEKNKAVGNYRSFREFVQKLVDWQKDEANLTFVAFFEKVVNESGFLDWVLSRADSVEKLNRLNSLFAEIKKLNLSDHRLNLERFFADLKVLTESRIAVNEEDLNIKTESVILTTAHGAKGLEFDYVFIVKALDGKFGNNKTRELIKLPPNLLSVADKGVSLPRRLLDKDLDPNEDERRLFYVALTRARQGVFVTYADSYFSDSVAQTAIPTMFLSEIDEAHKGEIKVAKYESEVREILSEVLRPVTEDRVSLPEKDFLKTVLTDFRLSVTALNTYLECPYKFKLNNLFRTPRAKDKYLSFGSAVHRALEILLRKFKSESRLPVSQYLLDQFEVALRREILTPEDETDVLNKGRKVLKAYYEFYKDRLVKPVFTEKFFGYGFSKVYLGDVPLTGKVDRIDLLEERLGGRRRVRVVDYKTGRPRSRNEVEGKTKGSDRSYKRQLVFYKLLADLDQAFNYEVVEAELDFVEGHEGKFVRHSFIISQSEIDELKAIIKEVMTKIRQLEFPRTQNYEVCTFCEFAPHCWPEGIPLKLPQQLGLPTEAEE